MLASSMTSNDAVLDISSTVTQVRRVLGDALQLGVRCVDLEEETLLLGNLPELDSMAVVTVITALETHFHFVVDDDDDLAEAFMTLGALSNYVARKSGAYPGS